VLDTLPDGAAAGEGRDSGDVTPPGAGVAPLAGAADLDASPVALVAPVLRGVKLGRLVDAGGCVGGGR